MKEYNINMLMDIAQGNEAVVCYNIHIDYKTKKEISRYRQTFYDATGHDVIFEHYHPVITHRMAKSEAEIEAMIEWEQQNPNIENLFREEWKRIDAARKETDAVGHVLIVEPTGIDVYADMPYYKEQKDYK